MIPLLDARRGRLMAALVAVSCAQLAATIFVSHSLHQLRHGWTVGIIGLAAAAAFALEVLQRRMCEGMGLAYATAVREELFRHLMAVDPQIIGRRRHGAMLLSFVGDMTALRQWVSEGLIRGILALLALAVMIGWMAIEMPRTAVLLGGVALLFGIIGIALLRPLHHAVRNVRRYRGRVSAFASDRLAASATVQACGRTDSEAGRLSRRIDKMNAASLQRSWLTGTFHALPHLATTIMLVIAVVMNAKSAGSIAGTVVLIGILGLALRDLARAGELMIPGRISQQRIGALYSLPAIQTIPAGSDAKVDPGLLVIDALQLAGSKAILRAIARPGETILLDGDPTLRGGLFRILAGLLTPEAGTIWWNGKQLTGLRASRRRRIVGFASPQLPLVAGSTALNLRYRARDAAPEELQEIASRWQVDLEGREANPTRVMLLRALLGKPPVLLLELEDRLLGDAEAGLLRNEIANWPGVVLMTTGHPILRACATCVWSFGKDGIAQFEPPPYELRFTMAKIHKIAG